MNKENTKTYLSASLTQQNTKAVKAPQKPRREPTTFTRLELIHTAIKNIREFIKLALDPEYKYWNFDVAAQEISNLTLDLARMDILLFEEADILDDIAYKMLVKAYYMDTEE